MPKVSVLVPIYNVEKYLRECLDSLVCQTLKDIEIICINDGSTDSSLEIIEEYAKKDGRIKVISKPNSGYGDSMNKGLEAATGECIGIVESDDFIRPEMFENLYKLLTQKDCDFVKSDFYYYWSNSKKCVKHGKMKPVNKITNAKKYINLLKIMPSIWSCLYKKEFLNKNNIRFLPTPGASYQDASFQYKTMMLAERIFITNEAYVYYRQDNESSSCNSKSKVFAICDEYNEINRAINEKKELKRFEQFVLAHHFMAYKWNLKRLARPFRKEFLKRYYEDFKKFNDEGVIKEDFFKYLKHPSEFHLLMESPIKYYRELLIKEKKRKWKEFRKKFISIRINSKRINIELFGKQILRIG